MITQQWMALGGGHPALAKTALLLSQSANPATQIGHYSAVIETESRLDMLAHEASVGSTGHIVGRHAGSLTVIGDSGWSPDRVIACGLKCPSNSRRGRAGHSQRRTK